MIQAAVVNAALMALNVIQSAIIAIELTTAEELSIEWLIHITTTHTHCAFVLSETNEFYTKHTQFPHFFLCSNSMWNRNKRPVNFF